MAAIQDIVVPQGVIANYHKLIRADFDEFAKVVEVTFAIYGSKALRDAGATPLSHQRLKFAFSDFVVDPRRALYDVVTKRQEGYLAGAPADDELPPPEPLLELKPPAPQEPPEDAEVPTDPPPGLDPTTVDAPPAVS